MKSRTAFSLSAAAVGLALTLSPPQAALAQDSAKNTADSAQPAVQAASAAPAAKPSGIPVMRTGSNIVRYRTGASLPLMEIDRTYIDRTGASTAPELLRTIPQLQVGR